MLAIAFLPSGLIFEPVRSDVSQRCAHLAVARLGPVKVARHEDVRVAVLVHAGDHVDELVDFACLHRQSSG